MSLNLCQRHPRLKVIQLLPLVWPQPLLATGAFVASVVVQASTIWALSIGCTRSKGVFALSAFFGHVGIYMPTFGALLERLMGISRL